MRSIKKLPIEASLWTNTPRAFIFLVCRLIQRKSNKNLEYRDLTKFLGANAWEVEDFMETMIFPLRWLFQLAKTEGGREILKIFNLPHNRVQLEELSEKNRIEGAIDIQSNVLGEFIPAPEVFLKKKDKPSIELGSGDSSKIENAVISEVIVSLNALLEEVESFSASVSGDFISKETSLDMSVSLVKVGSANNSLSKRGNYSADKKNVLKQGGVIKKKERKPYREKERLIANPKQQYLAGLHRITGSLNEFGLDEALGINGGVAKFKRTGVIPFEWIEALKKCNGGEKHTERFKDVFRVSSPKITIYTKEESESPQKTRKKVSLVEEALESEAVVVHAEKKSSGYNGHNLIPVGEVFRVLSCIRDRGLTDADIVGALEIDPDKGISYLRKGKERLHSGHLMVIAKKFNLNESVLAQWM